MNFGLYGMPLLRARAPEGHEGAAKAAARVEAMPMERGGDSQHHGERGALSHEELMWHGYRAMAGAY
ncbi:hypothetical protein AAHK20_23170 [Trinickia sp. YCB016]